MSVKVKYGYDHITVRPKKIYIFDKKYYTKNWRNLAEEKINPNSGTEVHRGNTSPCDEQNSETIECKECLFDSESDNMLLDFN